MMIDRLCRNVAGRERRMGMNSAAPTSTEPDDESIAAGVASDDAAPTPQATSGGRGCRSWVGIAAVGWLTSVSAAYAIGSWIVPGSELGAEMELKIVGVVIGAGIVGALAAGLLFGVRRRGEWAATVVLTFAGMLPVLALGAYAYVLGSVYAGF